ncbi:cellulose binding domain-containing protein [Candidatus Binatia bacterium]|nr:cellulose binding domain-containing protein [Candidatus Binatia bacterium]
MPVIRRGFVTAMFCSILAVEAYAQSVDYKVTADWGSGFQAQVTVRNSQATSLTDWVVEFDQPVTMTSLWDARLVSRVGNRYTIRGATWNPHIPAGGQVSFGFVATPGGAPAPANIVVRSGSGPTPTRAATRTATRTATSLATPTPTRPRTATRTPTRTPTGGVTTPTPTRTPTRPSTFTPTFSATATRPASTATQTRPPATATATASATATVTPRPGNGVRVVFTRTGAWDGGYNADLQITNTAATAVNGWTLEFDLNDRIDALWNGRLLSGSATHRIVANETWNGTLAPNAMATIGFTASGSTALPGGCVFNGASCTIEIGAPPSPTIGPGSGIVIEGVDAAGTPALQITVPLGTSDFTLARAGGGAGSFAVASNNPDTVTPAVIGAGTLRIDARQPGRAGVRIADTTSGAVRHVGVRVRHSDGSLPGFPQHLAVGSVSEDTPDDLALWRNFGSGRKNTRVDMRYIYLNGGPLNGWYGWAGGNGARATSYIRESKKLGMIPVFVYYNIPDGGESYYTDLEHIQSSTYMSAYFDDLMKALAIVRSEGGDDVVGIVLEPDFLGYMMQLSGLQPHQITAAVHAAYDRGILVRGTDPAFPDTVAGLVQAINYLIGREAPNAVFGWQFNLWASLTDGSGIPATGLMRITDSLGIAAGRARIQLEADRIAAYYMAAGVLSYGADFVSIDKYGLDGGFGGAAAPWDSTWFWNAVHWNNYVEFAGRVHQQTGVPVVLWQIPVGHVNSSLAVNPYATGGVFPDLTNTHQRYEDSAPTYFLGDRFSTSDAQRLAYFGQSDPGYPGSVSVDGTTVTWASHMAAARDAGIVAILFGDGVGDSTHGRGSPPPDGYWWITKAQDYLEQPVPLAP